jgi:hypothetical protein
VGAYDRAARVLELVTAGLRDAGVVVPERRYVTPGARPAWDAEQLTVGIVRPSVPGSPGREVAGARPCSGPRFVELRVELVRCLPVGDEDGTPATVKELEDAARQSVEDADALRRALDDDVEVTGRRGVPSLVGAMTVLGPDGGMVAVTTLVQVGL